MTKLIGIKELQQNTKMVREEVAKGTHFIVVYRSKPIFEISPLGSEYNFVDAMTKTDLYKKDFLDSMGEAQSDLNKANYVEQSAEEFLKNLEDEGTTN